MVQGLKKQYGVRMSQLRLLNLHYRNIYHEIIDRQHGSVLVMAPDKNYTSSKAGITSTAPSSWGLSKKNLTSSTTLAPTGSSSRAKAVPTASVRNTTHPHPKCPRNFRTQYWPGSMVKHSSLAPSGKTKYASTKICASTTSSTFRFQ